ncbi:MAG: acyl-CoA carboxylase subunit epsilon [Actinobacteria bacterium]|nr:acyl-CoA carboxylase subunit epsilon [Actinomycetota bacterium]
MRGEPSDEELAAVTVVVAGLAGAQRAAARAPAPTSPRSAWANPAHRLRAPAHCGPDTWRISAFPH